MRKLYATASINCGAIQAAQSVDKFVEVLQSHIQEKIFTVPQVVTQEVVRPIVETVIQQAAPQVVGEATFDVPQEFPQVTVQELLRQIPVALPVEVVDCVPVPQVQIVQQAVEVPEDHTVEHSEIDDVQSCEHDSDLARSQRLAVSAGEVISSLPNAEGKMQAAHVDYYSAN